MFGPPDARTPELLAVVVDDGARAPWGTVQLFGELDLSTVPLLEEQLDLLLRRGVRYLTLDLSGLTFCDGSGLRTLQQMSARAQDTGGDVHLIAPPASLTALLDLFELSLQLRPRGDG